MGLVFFRYETLIFAVVIVLATERSADVVFTFINFC